MVTKKSELGFRKTFKIGSALGKKAEEIRDDIPFQKLTSAVIIINLAVIIGILAIKRFLPPEVPLFYGLPEGGDQLGRDYQLAIPSIVSLCIIFLNIVIGIVVKDEFLVKILILTGIASTFFSLVTTFKIIFLVGGF